jgi:hypothetical protein
MRRLTVILAVWLSLLGVAMPVLACAMGVTDGDCCPVQTRSPCAGGVNELQSNVTITLCCSAGPTSAYVVSVDPRLTAQSNLHPSSPDQLVVSGWITTNPGSAAAQLNFPSSIPTHRADAALTYLRTGRLRL